MGGIKPEQIVLPDSKLLVGDGSGRAVAVEITGDVVPTYHPSDETLRFTLAGFGAEYQYTEDLLESSVTGTLNYQQKLSITVPITIEGYYRINWNFTWRHSKTSTSFLARIQLDNTDTIWTQQTSPTRIDTASRRPSAGFARSLLTVGSHFFDLDFATSSIADTAYIYEARMDIWRMTDG